MTAINKHNSFACTEVSWSFTIYSSFFVLGTPVLLSPLPRVPTAGAALCLLCSYLVLGCTALEWLALMKLSKYDTKKNPKNKQLCLFQLSILLPSILTHLFENLKITPLFFFPLSISSYHMPPLAFSTPPTQNKYFFCFSAATLSKKTSPKAYWSHSLAWTMRQLPFQPLCWLVFLNVYSWCIRPARTQGWSTALHLLSD